MLINTRGDSSPSPVQERGQKEKQAQWLRSGAREELGGKLMVASEGVDLLHPASKDHHHLRAPAAMLRW